MAKTPIFTNAPHTNNFPFVSSLALMLEPNIQNEIIKNFPADNAIKEFLTKEVPNMTLSNPTRTEWAEKGSDFNTECMISAVTVVGSTVVATYSAGDMYTVGGILYSPGAVGKDVIIANPTGTGIVKGKITAKNTAVNPHTVTITPMNANNNIVTAAIVGATIIFAGNSTTEASIPGVGVATDIVTYSNEVGITRGDWTHTDLSKKQTTYFNFTGADGKTTRYLTSEIDRTNAMEFLKDVVMQMLIGEQSNITMPAADNQNYIVRNTNGYLTQIEQGGLNFPFAVNPSITDLQEIASIMKDRGVRGEIDVKMGDYFQRAMETSVVNAFPNGIDYKKDGKTIDMRVGVFEFGSWKINLIGYELFDHPHLLGHSTLPYRNGAYFCPTDKRTDTLTGKKMPSMHMEYREPNNAGSGTILGVTKPFFKAWMNGGDAMQNQDGDMVERVHYISYIKPKIYGANRFVRAYKQ